MCASERAICRHGATTASQMSYPAFAETLDHHHHLPRISADLHTAPVTARWSIEPTMMAVIRGAHAVGSGPFVL